MIKSERKKQLQQQNQYSLQDTPKKSKVVLWLEQELKKFQYNLSDDCCQLLVNQIIREELNLIIIELYVKPQKGVFEKIQMRPKIYLSSVNMIKRPKIYNDRRLYHPNISLVSLEFMFPELCLEWNPTKEFREILQKLKQVCVEPNIRFVPDNKFNRMAGMRYRLSRDKFRGYIFENMPISFETENYCQLSNPKPYEAKSQENFSQECQWIDIESMLSNNLNKINQNPLKRHIKESNSDDQVYYLSKQMKKIHFNHQSEEEVYFNCCQTETQSNSLIEIENQ